MNKKGGNGKKLVDGLVVMLMKEYDLGVSEIEGGKLDNGIGREGDGVCGVGMGDKENVGVGLNILVGEVENEFGVREGKVSMEVEWESGCGEVMEKEGMRGLVD